MKRWIVRIAVALAVLFVAIQLAPAGRTNPPVTKTLEAPPEVLAILRRSCFDCHSNESRWPWYAYVAPVSWLVVHDVDEGRRELNFSHWGDMPQAKRDSKASSMVEEIEGGEMPLEPYLWMHSDAKLSPADLKVLQSWSEGDV
ncbi:MAG: heme-binding domain-containing protein [Planctomycetota bacterium]|nr:heme-binding domain-containing protein [Planctomycetota bacterium]